MTDGIVVNDDDDRAERMPADPRLFEKARERARAQSSARSRTD